MPGIYVNDGGATSSAIGNILGGIAQQVGPEGAAKAALLSQQTQGADISNQDAYEKLLAGEAAANSAAGLTRTLNMNATDPGQPSVAGTVTSLSQPPSATPGPGGRISRIDESGFTPEQKYIANEILNGRMSPAALQTGVDVFQTPLVGAGMTPGAIRTRSTTPLSPGQTINVTGVPGSGSTISGGSEYPSTFDKTTGASNPAALESDIRGGQAATVAHGKAQQALAIFDQYVAPNSDPAGILSEEAVRKLSEVTGMNFTRLTNADAKQQITQLFLGMVGSVRDTQGNPLPRDSMDNIRKLFADPDADPVRFHSMVNALVTSLDQQSKDGQAALTAYQSRSPEAYIEYLKQKGVNAEAARRAFEQAGVDIRQGREEPAAEAPPNPRAPQPRQAPGEYQLVPDTDAGMKLPSGTRFRTPDGKRWMVP
jgi:hypothetical protein